MIQAAFRHGVSGLILATAPILSPPAKAQDVWTVVTAPVTQNLNAVCWGGGKFVAVGDGGTILTSSDGAQWQARTGGTTSGLRGVTYGGGAYVAVGDAGTVLTSADGISWTARTSHATAALNAVVYGDRHFLTVGDGPTALTSVDGIEWVAATLSSGAALRGLVYAYGEFVAVGDGGALRHSADGKNYSSWSFGTKEIMAAITFGHRRFVAVGSTGVAFTGADGRYYQPAGPSPSIASYDLRGAAFFGENFVVVGGSGTILISPDASVWTACRSTAKARLNAVAPSSDVVVVVGDNGTIIRSEMAARAPVIATQPENRIAYATSDWLAGDPINFAVTASGTPSLSYQWSFNGSPIAGATDDLFLIEQVRGSDQAGEYSVTVRNAYGQVTSNVATLAVLPGPRSLIAPALIDPMFTPPSLTAVPKAASELNDGRILVAVGSDSAGKATPDGGMMILSADGSIDLSTSTPTLNMGAHVEKLMTRADGRILLIGDFTAVNGIARHNVARLLANASLDPTFVVPESLGISPAARICPLPNGAMLVSGAGDGKKLLKLFADGSADPSFAGQVASEGGFASIRNAVVDSSGRVLVACLSPSGQTFLARLLADGSQDSTYSTLSFGTGADVPLLAAGDFGRILYVRVSASGAPSVGSLSADGLADGRSAINFTATFRTGVQMKDGGIALALWNTASPNPSAIINRFLANGQSDSSFDFTGRADGEISGLASLRSGCLLALGPFTQIDKVTRPRLARLLAHNRAPVLPIVAVGVVPNAITVREGEPFTLSARAANTFNGCVWFDEKGAALGSTPLRFLSGYPGFVPTYTPYVRVDVLLQPSPILLSGPKFQPIYFTPYDGLVVTAAGQNIQYQWMKNGSPIPGATAHIYELTSALDLSAVYTVRISNANGSITSGAAELPPAAHLSNLSVRTSAGGGDRVLIVGFAIAGPALSGARPFLLRAAGPSLAQFGVTEFMSNPKLQVYAGTSLFGENDDWAGDPGVLATASQVGAFSFADVSSRDAALYLTANPGTYTAQVSGALSEAGIVLAEIYDASPAAGFSATTPRLTNLSVRGDVGTEANVMLVGFTITGTGSTTLLVRAVGPSLANFGVSGTLADPRLDILQSGQPGLLASNDNWISGSSSQVLAASSKVGAFSLSPGSKDAALILTLQPGSYTARVTGVGATTGIALVEIYVVP